MNTPLVQIPSTTALYSNRELSYQHRIKASPYAISSTNLLIHNQGIPARKHTHPAAWR